MRRRTNLHIYIGSMQTGFLFNRHFQSHTRRFPFVPVERLSIENDHESRGKISLSRVRVRRINFARRVRTSLSTSKTGAIFPLREDWHPQVGRRALGVQ